MRQYLKYSLLFQPLALNCTLQKSIFDYADHHTRIPQWITLFGGVFIVGYESKTPGHVMVSIQPPLLFFTRHTTLPDARHESRQTKSISRSIKIILRASTHMNQSTVYYTCSIQRIAMRIYRYSIYLICILILCKLKKIQS